MRSEDFKTQKRPHLNHNKLPNPPPQKQTVSYDLLTRYHNREQRHSTCVLDHRGGQRAHKQANKLGPARDGHQPQRPGENAPSHELVMRVLFMDHFGLCAHREQAHSDDRAARIPRTISSRCVFQMRLLGTVLKRGVI